MSDTDSHDADQGDVHGADHSADHSGNQGDGQGNDQPIFHAALPDDWAGAFTTGEYTMSTRGMTLAEVGFIHLSTREQVEGVANRFYADLDTLVLLTVDPAKVEPEIRWEPPAPGIDELFPHIYGPLAISAVITTNFWIRPELEPWSLSAL